MASFDSIVDDIRRIRIQGATNIAKAAVKAVLLGISGHRIESRDAQILFLKRSKEILFKSRPTEPCMRNSLNYLLAKIEDSPSLMESIHKRAEEIESHFKKSEEKIVECASRKVKSGEVIFTHCHSSTVVKSLVAAKKRGITFTVNNTETRPLFQGRITARDLAREGIQVNHYVDSAAMQALKKADIIFLGADAITSDGKVINKIGSGLFAEIAEKYDIPLYICTDSWKFDPSSVSGFEEKIEERPAAEIWPAAPEGVKISNLAFEKIDPKFITGIISEMGVYSPEVFIEEVKSKYPWILKS